MNNTNENNKLIAEFMGIDQVDIDTYQETNSNLKYHTSWDWLMPVVKKIKISVIDQDETDNPYNSEEWDKSTRNYELLNYCYYFGYNITHTLVQIEIKSLYQAVVEFIKEYNQNN